MNFSLYINTKMKLKECIQVKLTSDNKTLAQNKVLILYILSKIDKPITNGSLYELVIANQDINYFYFQQFLLDLIDTKYIISYLQENEPVYEITESGKNALDLIKDILPGIIRLKIDGSLKGNLSVIEESNSVSSEYIPINQNEYNVKCKIMEAGKTVFAIETHTTSREQAKLITENWEQNAVTLYPKLLEILSQSDASR